METWNKWVSAILWRSSRFARFVFTFNTSLFNFTNEILQRDFAIVFKGWPKEKSKLYSEDKEVMKMLKGMKWQHSLKYHGNDNCTTCSWNESVKLNGNNALRVKNFTDKITWKIGVSTILKSEISYFLR